LFFAHCSTEIQIKHIDFALSNRRIQQQKKKKNFFYLRTSTINGNFRGLPGAVDRTSIDDIVVG